MNLKPAIDFAFAILTPAVQIAAPIIITWFLSRFLHIKAQGDLGQRIISVASNAAAIGLSKANTLADAHAGDVNVKSAAISAGVDYFNRAISTKTLDAAKITVPVDAMIEAQLQKLLTPPAQPASAPAAVVPAPLLPPAPGQKTMDAIPDPKASTFLGEKL